MPLIAGGIVLLLLSMAGVEDRVSARLRVEYRDGERRNVCF